MKAKSLFKIFTVVGFLITVCGERGFAQIGETKSQCKSRVKKLKENNETAKSICEFSGIEKNSTVNSDIDAKNDQTRISSCVLKELERIATDECEGIDNTKEIQSRCDQSLKTYDDAVTKTNEECGYITMQGTKADCRETANRCKSGLNSFGSNREDSGSAAASLANIYGMVGNMNGGTSTANMNLYGCGIENDEKAADKKQTLDNKVATLREEIADLKKDALEADKELDEKKQSVEDKMREAEEDANKAKFEKQTKNAEDVARIQKATIESEKKRRYNNNLIVEKQVAIANLSFAQQKINLSMADSVIRSNCKDDALARLNKIRTGIDPKTGKPITQRYSQAESLRLRKNLKLAEAQCLQEKAIEKQASLKSIIDNKRRTQAEIATLEASNADEAKSIENQMKQLEAMKAIAAEEEKKALESKMIKLKTLNDSVVSMEKNIAAKKLTYAEKSKSKEDRINQLILESQNVKSRFARVSAAAEKSGSAANTFVEQCCTNTKGSYNLNHKACGRVISDEDGDDKIPLNANPYSAKSKK